MRASTGRGWSLASKAVSKVAASHFPVVQAGGYGVTKYPARCNDGMNDRSRFADGAGHSRFAWRHPIVVLAWFLFSLLGLPAQDENQAVEPERDSIHQFLTDRHPSPADEWVGWLKSRGLSDKEIVAKLCYWIEQPYHRGPRKKWSLLAKRGIACALACFGDAPEIKKLALELTASASDYDNPDGILYAIGYSAGLHAVDPAFQREVLKRLKGVPEAESVFKEKTEKRFGVKYFQQLAGTGPLPKAPVPFLWKIAAGVVGLLFVAVAFVRRAKRKGRDRSVPN